MILDLMTVNGLENGSADVGEGTLELRADAKTDWFFRPDGQDRKSNVTSLSMGLDRPVFSLSARVSVAFASAYDAGAIFVKCDEDNWAKVAFEFSAGHKPTIVSVVTRTTSDDSDGPSFPAPHAWLRAYCDEGTLAFHFSEDGRYWQFLRWFTLPGLAKRPVELGFGVQSPTGSGTKATFTDIELKFDRIGNLRNGE